MGGSPGARRAGEHPSPVVRVGTGYDSHRFDPHRPLKLGGVHFPGSPGLSGFSDGDAVGHAVIDALLGAACLGDIGTHFPPGEEAWRDADSMELLAASVAMLRDEGWAVGNVDVTVICERPRIGPRAAEMRARLAERMGVGAGAVSVKGKSNEAMGWIGRGEGIAVHAVATVVRASYG
ncbi:MAG: 2-C-methyl-D-erythritol 2,4-cyclodiphosphate synthase [Gemmatimonadetes bacterium]|nr:2-C-methyl-D-erythritol 2,4-cyclodiphosphate synthase [Gemmatimonadota bacterium]MYG20911.1 2-C-methyl-D-erythritol 2,4-cyclodiphosphate synthase [Gemmatimonadota bacterium]MYJ38269.1 2-C-methyl-D-erythritol 2,4-cyclodiphosphate synthase [Gemmatimonadota bacterium]